jgi:hypothetical protein
MNHIMTVTIPDVSPASELKFITELDGVAHRLIQLGQNSQLVLTHAWQSICRNLPLRVIENRQNYKGPNSYLEQFGDDNGYFTHDLEGTFHHFVQWLCSVHAANKNLPNSGNLENLPAASILKVESQMKTMLDEQAKIKQSQQQQMQQTQQVTNKLAQQIQSFALASASNQAGPSTAPQAAPSQPQPSDSRGQKRKRDDQPRNRVRFSCVFCGESHFAAQCSKNIQERKAIAVQKNICQNCYQSDHLAETCPEEFRCKSCKNKPNQVKHAASFCQISYDYFQRRQAKRVKKENPTQDGSQPPPPPSTSQ